MIQAPMVILRLPDYNIGVGRFRIFFFWGGGGGGQGLEYWGGGGKEGRILSRHMTS